MQKSNIINTCYKLTMTKFLDCLFDNNYSALGEGSEEELQDAWKKVYNEFVNLRQDKTTSELFNISKEMELLRLKLKMINECLKVLWIRHNRDVVLELQKLGFAHLRFDAANKPQYLKQLNDVAEISKRYQVDITKREKEIAALMQKNKGKTVGRESFLLINGNLSKYMNFYVDNTKVVVADWCVMVNQLEKHIEQLNVAKQKLA